MMTKKYYLFAGHHYYPKGGAFDFRIVGTINECKTFFFDNAEQISDYGGYINNWGQIVDIETMKIILVGEYNRSGIKTDGKPTTQAHTDYINKQREF